MRRYCTAAVMLGIGLAAPAAAHATTFTVDRNSDNPADGDCSVAGGPCTLRAAVDRANAEPGPDRIELGARTVVLSHEDGDLDVTEELTITGAGSALSVIDGSGIEGPDPVRRGGSHPREHPPHPRAGRRGPLRG